MHNDKKTAKNKVLATSTPPMVKISQQTHTRPKRLKLSCLKNLSNRNVFAEYICILYSVFAEYHFSFTCKDHGTHQLRFCFDFHRWCWLLLLFCCCSNGCIRDGSVIQIFTVNRFNGEWFAFVGSLVCTLKISKYQRLTLSPFFIFVNF